MLDFTLCHPRRKDGVVLRNLSDDAILYDPATKKAHVLNKTSLLIWNLCTGDVSLDEIEKSIRSQFMIDDDSDVRMDIEETVTKFSAEGLVLLQADPNN
jgi:hypothetical protein